MLINFVDATNDASHYTKPPPYLCSDIRCVQQLTGASLL